MCELYINKDTVTAQIVMSIVFYMGTGFSYLFQFKLQLKFTLKSGSKF